MARESDVLDKNRPSDGSDDWYEARKAAAQADGSIEDLGGLSPEEQAKLDQIEAGLQDPGQQEVNADSKDGQQSAVSDKEKQLQNKDDDTVGAGFQKEKGKRISIASQFTRKRATIGGAVTTGIVTIAVGIFASGPAFFSEFVNDILTGKIGEIQTGQQAAYRRARFNKFSDILTREGRLGGAIIREMETKGYRFAFDPADKNKIISITPPNSNVSILNTTGGQMEELFDAYLTENKPKLRSSKWKTARMDAFYNRYKVSRKSVVQVSPDDPPDARQTVNKNVRAATTGDDIRVTSSIDGANVSPEEIEANRSAVSVIAEPTGILDESIAKLDAGITLASTGSITDSFVDGSAIAGINLADEASRGVNLGNVARGAFTADIINKLCTLKNKVVAGFIAARVYRNLASIRLAMSYIGANDAQRAGIANAALFGALMSNVGSLDSNGQPFGASSGVQAALTGRFSKSSNDTDKSLFSVDADRTGFTGELADVLEGGVAGEVTGRRTCAILGSGGGQATLGVIEVALVIGSGGTAGVAGTGVKTAVKTAVSNVIKQSLTKKGLLGIAGGVALELSFETITSYAQLEAERSLLASPTSQERGKMLGDVTTTGGGSANKQQSLDVGFVPATTTQFRTALAEFEAQKAEELKQQSFFARMFDMDNLDSFAFNNFIHVPMSVDHAGYALHNGTQSLALSPVNLGSHTIASVGSLLGGETYAQAADPDIVAFDEHEITTGTLAGTTLAIDAGGNIQTIMRLDIAEIDPYENLDELVRLGHINQDFEPSSEEFRKHYETCVVNVDTFSTLEQDDPEDCMATKDITKRFKAHLAHLNFISGLTADFLPETLESVSNLNVEVGDFTDIEAFAENKRVDTSNVPCAPGFTSERVVSVGTGTFSVRLCTYDGVRDVNAAWSPAVSQMVVAAKEEDNLALVGGGFRTAEKQIQLRRNHCGKTTYAIFQAPPSECSPPTARPGTSNHELGLAVDFVLGPGGQRERPGDPVYDWLVDNAARFGIKKLSSEAWHWSIDGK